MLWRLLDNDNGEIEAVVGGEEELCTGEENAATCTTTDGDEKSRTANATANANANDATRILQKRFLGMVRNL